jgi:hypothetical protein
VIVAIKKNAATWAGCDCRFECPMSRRQNSSSREGVLSSAKKIPAGQRLHLVVESRNLAREVRDLSLEPVVVKGGPVFKPQNGRPKPKNGALELQNPKLKPADRSAKWWRLLLRPSGRMSALRSGRTRNDLSHR